MLSSIMDLTLQTPRMQPRSERLQFFMALSGYGDVSLDGRLRPRPDFVPAAASTPHYHQSSWFQPAHQPVEFNTCSNDIINSHFDNYRSTTPSTSRLTSTSAAVNYDIRSNAADDSRMVRPTSDTPQTEFTRSAGQDIPMRHNAFIIDQSTTHSTNTMQSQLKKTSNYKSTSRRPKCVRCKNHGIISILKGHRPSCPYLNCSCSKCLLITERRHLNAARTALLKNGQDEPPPPSTKETHEEAVKVLYLESRYSSEEDKKAFLTILLLRVFHNDPVKLLEHMEDLPLAYQTN